MTVISGHEIVRRGILSPSEPRTTHEPSGLTFGAGPASYDLRIKQDLVLLPNDFCLASTIEHWTMPNDLQGILHDKSTLARRGLSVFNTLVDPGFKGWLTLELKNNSSKTILLRAGQPIAQVAFHLVSGVVTPYDGRYQDQADYPVAGKYVQ